MIPRLHSGDCDRCAVLEERINDRVTILIDLYSIRGRKECVGFTLKSAYHLCQQHGWNTSRPIKMSQLLDAILASVPEKAVKVFIELVAKPLVEDKQIEQVDASDRDLACVPA